MNAHAGLVAAILLRRGAKWAQVSCWQAAALSYLLAASAVLHSLLETDVERMRGGTCSEEVSSPNAKTFNLLTRKIRDSD